MLKPTPEVVKNIFKDVFNSNGSIIVSGAQYSDYLKKHSIVGFFTETSVQALYDYIYAREAGEQDDNLDLVFTIYNAICNYEVDIDYLLSNYMLYVDSKNLHSALKDLYKFESDKVDPIVVTSYFVRLYIDYFDSAIISINNIKKKG